MDWQLAAFEELQELVFAFEQLLGRHGIVIYPGSVLERACLSVMDASHKKQHASLARSAVDPRPGLIDALGVWPFITKLIRLETHPEFGQIIPHLKLLNAGGFAQNVAARTAELNDQNPAKIFELLVALASMEIGTDLLVDDPLNAKGDNPDVMVTIDGTRWAFGCKVMVGGSPKSLFDRIQEGLDQIKRSKADRGVVIVNLKNRFQHDGFWPTMNPQDVRSGAEPVFGAQVSLAGAVAGLRKIADQQVAAMVAAVGEEEVRALFDTEQLVPALLLFLQTTMAFNSPLGPLPSTFPIIRVHPFGKSPSSQRVFRKLHNALHNLVIREERAEDQEAIRAVNRAAFARDEEAALVDRLRKEGLIVASLVAVAQGRVIGHIVFSELPINGSCRPLNAVSLAPLAVRPEYQHQDIGSSLVYEGLAVCAEQRKKVAVVLGEPEYYQRFGFSSLLGERLQSPFSNAGKAWMAIELEPGVLEGVSATVEYPEAFRSV